MTIKDLTEEHLFAIANIATADYFNAPQSREHKEVEVGGYGKRRRVIWISNREGYDEYNSFTITSEYGAASWSCEVSTNLTDWTRGDNWNIDNKQAYKVNSCNPAGIIDYCDKHGIKVRGEK